MLGELKGVRGGIKCSHPDMAMGLDESVRSGNGGEGGSVCILHVI